MIGILLAGAVAGLGVAVLVSWALPGQPSLADAITRLDPDPDSPAPMGGGGVGERFGGWAIRRLPGRWLAVPRHDLRLLGISNETFVGQRAAFAVVGVLFPMSFVLLGGLVRLLMPIAMPPMSISLGAALVVGAAFSFIPVAEVRRKAAVGREDFSRAVASYIDLVGLARRGGSGTSESLHAAALVGDSWAFDRIRDAIIRADWAGESPWEALAALGRELDVPPLTDLGDIMRLAGVEGAGVQQTLQARAAAVRNQLLATDLARANVASEALALPVAGLGLIFFALLAAPALIRIVGGM